MDQQTMTTEQTEILERQRRIARKMADEDRKQLLGDPKMRRSMIMRRLMTTARHDPMIQANAEAVMGQLQREQAERLKEIHGEEGANLQNSGKNSDPTLEMFRITVSPDQAKQAMRSFVVRREFSRRLREAAPKSTPPGVITEAEFHAMQLEMANHKPEDFNAEG